METILLQLVDWDGENAGLVETNCDLLTAQTMYSDYFNDGLDHLPKGELTQIGYPEDLSADGFASYLRLTGFKAKRIFAFEIFS